MFPPRLNDATVHEAKVCVVRVAFESDANNYGVRRQAQRDAALDGCTSAEIRREIEEKRRRASLAAALHTGLIAPIAAGC